MAFPAHLHQFYLTNSNHYRPIWMTNRKVYAVSSDDEGDECTFSIGDEVGFQACGAVWVFAFAGFAWGGRAGIGVRSGSRGISSGGGGAALGGDGVVDRFAVSQCRATRAIRVVVDRIVEPDHFVAGGVERAGGYGAARLPRCVTNDSTRADDRAAGFNPAIDASSDDRARDVDAVIRLCCRHDNSAHA